MELDDQRAEKWDRAVDDMIATKLIVSRIEKRVAEMNGTVAELQGAQLIQRGMLMATMGFVTVTGATAGVVAVIIRIGG